MAASITDVVDCTGANYPAVSRVYGSAPYVLAGYDTGSGGVPWLPAYWAAHPDAVHYDQDVAASDPLSDLLDIEGAAAGPEEAASWKRRADAARAAGRRRGQRVPGLYFSRSLLHTVVNALDIAGVTQCPLVIADYGMPPAGITRAAAAAEVQANAATAPNPYPIVGRQYRDAGACDMNVFLTSWLNDRSGMDTTPTPQAPPGQWLNADEWTWQEVQITGIGLNGALITWILDPATGAWSRKIG